MKYQLIALSSFLALTLVTSTNADVFEFNDRTSFENATGNQNLFDFNNLSSGDNNLGNSVVFGEATISVNNGGGVWSTDSFGAPTVQIASLNGDPLTIELNPGFHAIGMDIGELVGSQTFNLIVGGESGDWLDVTRIVAHNDDLGTVNTTFFGFVSDSDEIRSLQIIGPNFQAIDNLVYTNAVPEPTTIPLLLGLVAGFSARRRRQKNALL